MSDKAEQKHTPLPWKFSPNRPRKFSAGVFSGHIYVAEVIGNDDCINNAKFIISACNNHYKLVEALEEIAWSNDSKWQADRARQALAEVKS